jgi:amino acid adenylation domain-containing protein
LLAGDDEPTAPIGLLDLLPASELSLVLEEWNRTHADYPRTLCIHHLFEQQVTRTPDATAVTFEREHVTYADLNARANRLARHLIAHGVGPDICVGVCLDRSLEMVVGVLAVLKAGGAYVALDPAHPKERLRGMLADCAPAVVLAHLSLAVCFAGMAVSVIAVDGDAAWAGQRDANVERPALTPEHLVYVIYTSGSTGAPKGVMNEHRTLVNRVAWARRAWELTAADAVLCLTPLTFDGSVREIFLPLSTGARVVLTRPGGHRDPAYLVATIQRQRITTVNLVPSLLQLLVNEVGLQECTTVRQVLCGGESMTSALVARLRERLPRVQLRHLYGPSEAATALTVVDCIGHTGASAVPVGQPIANTRAYLVDRWGRPVPVGVVGELYIGGAGVGRGYVGRAALTAERFVPDPFSVKPGARQYRTGDLGRWLADGQIEFLGRTDFQVKVRGQRVEPTEVEACLCSHSDVREAIVIAREDAPGDQRLVAYYVASRQVRAETLRAHLSEQLPQFMVPAAYVPLDRLPLTSHGKLDRNALPAPAEGAYARRSFEAPVDDTERVLAEIWSEVLGLQRVSRRDQFFDLGGHSLLAVQVISRVRQALEVEVALSELFTRPVLAEFAEAIVDAQLAQFDPDEVAELAALLRSSAPDDARVLP